MKKLTKNDFILLLGITVLGLSSCKKDSVEPEILYIESGSSLTSKEGYQVTIIDVNDSRCPQNTCSTCFPNVAIVNFNVKKGDKEISFPINYPGCYLENKDTVYSQIIDDNLKLKITIYSITPYTNGENLSKNLKISIESI